MSRRWYFGWALVLGCFVMATLSWGFGFYGTAVYLVQLVDQHGWSVSLISSAVTLYWLIGACFVMVSGGLLDRLGPRLGTLIGAAAMALSLVLVPRLTASWQLHAVLVLMAVGWATMSSAAINVILAPWFDRKRGIAVSIALTGASMGGILVVPLLTLAITRWGFADAMLGAATILLGTMSLIALRVFVREPAALGLLVDGAPAPDASGRTAGTPAHESSVPYSLRTTLRTPVFWTITIAFALGLTAQVGFLTHQIALLEPRIGRQDAALAVSVTTMFAIVGRIIVGALSDRLERRVLAAMNFFVQALAILLLLHGTDSWTIWCACALYGIGVGNMITFPGLLVQQSFAPEHFGAVTRLVLGICQATFASGPMIMAFVRDTTGSYAAALWLVAGAVLVGGLIVALRPATSAAHRSR